MDANQIRENLLVIQQLCEAPYWRSGYARRRVRIKNLARESLEILQQIWVAEAVSAFRCEKSGSQEVSVKKSVKKSDSQEVSLSGDHPGPGAP